jgi:hypothetical protein
MEMKRGKKEPKTQTGLEVSLERLRGRQSVRTTFRLPEEIIVLLGIVADQFGLQQKALLDQLIDNAEFMKIPEEPARESVRERPAFRPKTFVLSKSSLHILEKVSRERGIPRDVLVAAVIQQLMPIIRAEREKQRKRQEIYEELLSVVRYGKKLLAKSEDYLGREDNVYGMIDKMIRQGEECVAKMAEILERGRNMEEVDLDLAE